MHHAHTGVAPSVHDRMKQRLPGAALVGSRQRRRTLTPDLGVGAGQDPELASGAFDSLILRPGDLRRARYRMSE